MLSSCQQPAEHEEEEQKSEQKVQRPCNSALQAKWNFINNSAHQHDRHEFPNGNRLAVKTGSQAFQAHIGNRNIRDSALPDQAVNGTGELRKRRRRRYSS